MKVDYITHSGDDLLVVNAARVSFHKESDWERQHFDHITRDEDIGLRVLSEQDTRLIGYLARNNHWTPFSHPTVTVRVKAPIFVARQLFKHKVGMTENEVSRRYVDDEPEFFDPEGWRAAPTGGAKQGSADYTIEDMTFYGTVESWDGSPDEFYWSAVEGCVTCYNSMIKAGIAPEQARMVLPQSMYTEWYWTGSLASFARIYKLRSDPHAQQETQEIAKMIDTIVRPLFPVSWKVLVE